MHSLRASLSVNSLLSNHVLLLERFRVKEEEGKMADHGDIIYGVLVPSSGRCYVTHKAGKKKKSSKKVRNTM